MAANASLPEYPLEQSRTLRSLREHSKEIQNPLEGMTREDLANDATRFATLCEVESGEEVEIFVRGVMLAAGLDVEGADAAESAALKMETERKWKLSWALWVTCVGNAMAAVVQGMDEYAIISMLSA